MTSNETGRFNAFVSEEIIKELRRVFPVALSRRDDTDWERGIAWGKQELIDYLEVASTRQAKNKTINQSK